MKLRLTRRSLRLAFGAVLFAYVTAHFVNHALGLISMEAAEQGLRFAVGVWQSPVGTLLLYGAVSTHIGLAFIAIHQHRTLRLPPLEWLRIAAGLSIPTLLIGHAVDTRLALEIYVMEMRASASPQSQDCSCSKALNARLASCACCGATCDCTTA